MKQQKIKLDLPKVKSFVTSSEKVLREKAKGHDGGYTWVG